MRVQLENLWAVVDGGRAGLPLRTSLMISEARLSSDAKARPRPRARGMFNSIGHSYLLLLFYFERHSLAENHDLHHAFYKVQWMFIHASGSPNC